MSERVEKLRFFFQHDNTHSHIQPPHPPLFSDPRRKNYPPPTPTRSTKAVPNLPPCGICREAAPPEAPKSPPEG